jgi:hypothetical protein
MWQVPIAAATSATDKGVDPSRPDFRQKAISHSRDGESSGRRQRLGPIGRLIRGEYAGINRFVEAEAPLTGLRGRADLVAEPPLTGRFPGLMQAFLERIALGDRRRAMIGGNRKPAWPGAAGMEETGDALIEVLPVHGHFLPIIKCGGRRGRGASRYRPDGAPWPAPPHPAHTSRWHREFRGATATPADFLPDHDW